MGDIRKGRVSGIDYKNGMLSVTYSDKGKSVTRKFPYINCNGEYKMPGVGESVLVAHLSNGSSRGVVIGTYWNKSNTPAECGSGIYRKEMSRTPGKAYQRFSDAGGIYEISSPKIHLEAKELFELISKTVKMQIEEELKILSKQMLLEIDEKIEAVSKTVSITGKEKLEVYSENGTDVKSDTELNLEDANWRTTLTKIMDRLEALDGISEDKK